MNLFQRTNALIYARVLLAIFLLTTAINRFSIADAAYYTMQLTAVGIPDLPWLSSFIGIFQLIVCISLVVPQYKLSQRILLAYAITALVPLLMLFTHPVWIESLGGFPAIGAGQGLIKYLAIAGVAYYLSCYYAHHEKQLDSARFVMLVGILLVMTWIGGMKFTQIEADGIFPLMDSSPLFSWIYTFFSPLHGSYFIGIVELIGVLAILLYKWKNWLYLFGLAICAFTFLATQTFIITLPAFGSEGVIPMLTGSGQFIIKDLGLLAACVLLLSHYLNPKAEQASS